MSLPSWLLREVERSSQHSHVRVYVGADADHRALAGTLILNRDEAEDLFVQTSHVRGRVVIERADLTDAPAAGEIRRPPSCPREGVVPAFDAGWRAHEVGLDRETVITQAANPNVTWAVLGYDIRAELAGQRG